MPSLRFIVLLTFSLPFVVIAQGLPHPYEPGVDIIHYTFSLDLPDTGKIIQGNARILFRRTEDVKFLTLDLVHLNVSGVTLNGTEVGFKRDSAHIRIPLPSLQSTLPRDSLVAEVHYHGPVADGLIIRDDDGGRTYFGDNWPQRARLWLPTVDHPSDKATVTWDVTAPANLTVVANGGLVMRTPLSSAAGSRVRTIWTCERPVPTYVMVLAAGDFIDRDLGLSAQHDSEFPGGVRQSLYTFSDQSSHRFGVFDSAISIVNYFSKTIGPFPYEKLAHCESSTIYGGMENASAIFYPADAFKKDRLTDELIAHETAHQWFGDAITPRTWPNLWLSEGFATYFAQLWLEQSRGDSSFMSSMAAMRSFVLNSAMTVKKPVLDTVESNLTALLNSNTYQKGAWVLHMLRSIMGDSNFFTGIRLYYEDFKHQTSVTQDLQMEMERVSGAQLGWFFDQWLRRPGFIDADLEWKFDTKTRRVKLVLRQGTGFPPFRFQLSLALLRAGRERVMKVIEVPALEEFTTSIPWDFGDPPSGVVPDPDIRVLGTIRIR